MEQDSNTVIDFTKIKLFSLETIMPLPLFSMMNDFLDIFFLFFFVFLSITYYDVLYRQLVTTNNY